ncbi:MAG: hypothetical protein J5472_02425 [Clostridia bacterium]|nr:hypothetical protein [Clostridia bacterium]
MKKFKWAVLAVSLVLIVFGLSGLIAGLARTSEKSYLLSKEQYEENREKLNYYTAVQLCISFIQGNHPEEAAKYKQQYPEIDQKIKYFSASPEKEAELSELIESFRKIRNEESNRMRSIERSGRDAVTNGAVILTVGVLLLVVFFIMVARNYKMNPTVMEQEKRS